MTYRDCDIPVRFCSTNQALSTGQEGRGDPCLDRLCLVFCMGVGDFGHSIARKGLGLWIGRG